MKTKSKCIGCQSIKLVNALGLCKRCNRHAHDFISKQEMDRLKLEREMLLSSKAAKKAQELEDKEKEEKEKEGEPGEEGAEDAEAKDGGADADSGDSE